ncbi:hypothetical protein BGZ54_005668 [Gamsiella multidivaricata]|nr:hypothetical protein BGZ54_005668 [Gamsiella multidivaricata]
MSSALDTVRNYLLGGAEEVLALTMPVSPLEKRGLMRIEKRRDQCSSSTYCPDGYHCISAVYCKKNTNYAWTAVFGVLLLLAIILCCVRRRRARAAMAAPQTVVTSDPHYSVPPQIYAPPAGDPNLAYQTPGPYPGSPYPAGTYPPPASAPYGEKPLETPPAAYSAYPPSSGAYSAAPPASTNYPAPDVPAPAYSGSPYPPPVGQPQGSLYPPPAGLPQDPNHAGPVPYPVPHGEASSYNPPK